MPDLAVLYEHPEWFAPLFAALDRRGIDYVRAVAPTAIGTRPTRRRPPAWCSTASPCRASCRGRRAPDLPRHRAARPLAARRRARRQRRRRAGDRRVQGAPAVADRRARPRDPRDPRRPPRRRRARRGASDRLSAGRQGEHRRLGRGDHPLRQHGRAALGGRRRASCRPASTACCWCRTMSPRRDGAITRIETLDRRFLYAIEVAGGGAFDLCPADACVEGSGISMRAVQPAPALVDGGRGDRRARWTWTSAGSR